jgi:CRP-like cAMP-binding protein
MPETLAAARLADVADLAAVRRRRLTEAETPLRGIGLFAGMAEDDLAGLAAALQPVALAAGGVLWHQGSPSDGLYVLLDGDVQVCRRLPGERELEVARLGPGELLGELPLLGGGTRTATVRALGACSLLFLSRAEFDARTALGEPGALELRRRVVAIACARLRRTYCAAATTVYDAASLPASAPSEPLQREPMPAAAPPRDYLARLELFRGLEPDVVTELLDRGTVLCLPRGHVIQREGTQPEACHVTLNGAVEAVVRRGTASLRVGFAGPGRPSGYLGMLDGAPAPVSSVTRERSLLLAIDRSHFATLQRTTGTRSRAFLAAIEADVVRCLAVAEGVRSRVAAGSAA